MGHRKTIGRFAWVAVAALSAFALIAAACGDDNNNSSKTPSGSSSTATKPASSPTKAATSPTAGSTAATTPAAGGATTVKVASSSLGQILTDANGMTLYVFKNDTANSGKSACNGGCATAWPPLAASGTPTKPAEATGDITAITRDDGSKQVAYKGLPLYHFASDVAPGDTKGEGVGGVWTVAKP